VLTAKLWRKHRLSYDQSKHVVEEARRTLGLEAPRERRRTVERLDRAEVERLIEAAYAHSSRHGFLVKLLFYTGARVSEFVRIRVEDLQLALASAEARNPSTTSIGSTSPCASP
jgi:integrase/recombinase XerD